MDLQGHNNINLRSLCVTVLLRYNIVQGFPNSILLYF